MTPNPIKDLIEKRKRKLRPYTGVISDDENNVKRHYEQSLGYNQALDNLIQDLPYFLKSLEDGLVERIRHQFTESILKRIESTEKDIKAGVTGDHARIWLDGLVESTNIIARTIFKSN